jgi:hypothetical protein
MFWLGTASVLPFWFLIIFFPRRSVTRKIVESALPLVLPASVHTAFIVMLLRSRPDLKDDYAALFPLSSSKVITKLTERDMATVSWLHMLPGDLFAGRWIYLDSRKRNLNPWLVSLVLVVTCTSGSIGFVLYLLLRVLAAFLEKSGLTLARYEPIGKGD